MYTTKIKTKRIITVLFMVAVITTTAKAQIQVSFGPGAGINYSIYSFDEVDESYYDLGPLITSQVDMQFSRIFSLLLWIDFYSDMSVKETEGDTYDKYNINYLSFSPTLKFCLPRSPFYIYAGPGVGIKTKGKRTFGYSDSSISSDVSDMSTRLDARFGVGYDFFLTQKLTLSPFAGFNVGLNDVIPDTGWKINALQAGIVLRFNAF